MKPGNYIRLKGRISYFRRKIPSNLRKRLDCCEICYKLGVVSTNEAVRLARALAVAVDTFFCDAELDPMLSSVDLAKVIETTLSTWVSQDRQRANEHTMKWGHSINSAKEDAEFYSKAALRFMTNYNAGTSLFSPTATQEFIGAALGATQTDNSTLHQTGNILGLALSAHYFRTAISTAKLHRLDEGFLPFPIAKHQNYLDRVTERLAELTTSGSGLQLPNSPTTPPKAPPVLVAQQPETAPSLLFSELAEKCLANRIENREMSNAVARQAAASIRIWIETCGDKDCKDYTSQDFTDFRSTLIKIPKVYWRSAAERKKIIHDVIKDAKSDYTRISAQTVNRHLSTINPIFKWGIDNKRVPAALGASLSGNQMNDKNAIPAEEQRPAYSHDQIEKIFKHPCFTGRLSEYYYSASGSVIIRDALFWGFIIACLHGMRREEFSQLKVKHVKEVSGVWVFDLMEKGLHLKNRASRRHVPLHQKLLELEFIEQVVEGRKDDDLLFSDLHLSANDRKFGDALGKRAGRVISKLEIKLVREDSTQADGVFHPFRHSLITALTGEGVAAGLIDGITGHTSSDRTSERKRYQKRQLIEKLKAAIDRYHPPIDVEKLNELYKNRPNKLRVRRAIQDGGPRSSKALAT